MVGVGIRAGADLALSEGLDLTAEVEVGANLRGLELQLPAVRSGLLGAYWDVDVGLNFH